MAAESGESIPGPPPEIWKAGELARRAGMTRQALHQYISMGLLTPVAHTKGGQRLFGPDSLARIKLVQNLCATNGYTLQYIRETFFKDRAS